MPKVVLNWVGKIVGQGRYRVESRLGEGGMGAVYLATDLTTQTVVALKTPRLALLEDPSFFKRFQREMKAMLQLQHPHLVPLIDIGEENRIPFIVMRYLPGGSLRDRMKQKKLNGTKDLFPWLREIASMLDYLHERSVVHRDVKPENILFDKRGGLIQPIWVR